MNSTFGTGNENSAGVMQRAAICYDDILQRLQRSKPVLSPDNGRKPAAVALMLHRNRTGLELFFIQRAHHPDDPWSGNIGFPGGGAEAQDAGLRHTAERETLEEVGIDLSQASYLGRLSDIVGHNLPVRVSCFVYGLHELRTPVFSPEVQDAFWVDFDQLVAAERQVVETVCFDGRFFEVPAIMLHPAKPVLWGITYRLVSQFRHLLLPGSRTPAEYDLPL